MNLQGKLLVATQANKDTEFENSVILITRHDKFGAAGYVLNVLDTQPVKKIIDNAAADRMLNIGGPVFGPPMLLHDIPALGTEVIPGVYITYDKIQINHFAKVVSSISKYKFFIGYTGWANSQIEDEIENNYWKVQDASAELVFSTEDIWDNLNLDVKNINKNNVYKSLNLPKNANFQFN